MFKLATAILSLLFIFAPATVNASEPDHLVAVTVDSNYEKFERKKLKNQRMPRMCNDQLYRWLYDAGFRGHNIREAWAIAMRESNGKPTQISNGVDHGLFQFNRPSWGGKSWWNTQMLLTPVYNAKIAYQLSDGGNNWQPWGMGDHNEFNFTNYGMWSEWQLYNWIVEPYQRYYAQYPC